MKMIGEIVLLQVQLASLKVGGRRERAYDPTPIQSVPALHLAPEGVMGHSGAPDAIVDVHHRDHPSSKNRGGENGISVGFTAHYDRMRTRFGRHLVDGLAGENILVQAEEIVRDLDLRDGIVIMTAAGRTAHLNSVQAAEPCVEFSRYALRQERAARDNRDLAEALRFLRGGMRGFYARYDGEPCIVQPGDRVFAG